MTVAAAAWGAGAGTVTAAVQLARHVEAGGHITPGEISLFGIAGPILSAISVALIYKWRQEVSPPSPPPSAVHRRRRRALPTDPAELAQLEARVHAARVHAERQEDA